MTERNDESRLTYVDLIKMEISGKNAAQAGYDSILWKIRSGYAIMLYGALSLIVTSGDKQLLILTPTKISIILSIIIIGFSMFMALIDYHFLKCKIRVVGANNELMNIAVKFASDLEITDDDRSRLTQLLHNSGESLDKIDWTKWNSRSPLSLYAFTVIVGILVIHLSIFI